MQLLNCFLMVLLCGFANACQEQAAKSLGLVLSGWNKVESRGCYNFNQSISLCFHIRPSSMKLETKEGKILVLHRQVGKELFLFQIASVRFLGFKSRMIAIPFDAPTSPDELLAFWYRNYGPKYELSDGEAELQLKLDYERALKELRKTPEILLIELVSHGLAHHKHQIEALTSFHHMCLSLLKSLAVQLPAEFEAVEQPSDREKRAVPQCQDLRSDPNRNQCLGMCGRRCSCWRWVCRDCCRHNGCYQHDLCCGKKFTSAFCLTPWRYSFKCGSFGGYPRCLRS